MSLTRLAIMRVGAACLGSMLLLAAPLRADDDAGSGEKNDVLYMKNGDRMTCEIKSLDAGSLQVSLDYVDGTISVQWSRVQRLDSKRLFIVTLEDGSVYSGTLSIAETLPDEPTKLQISSGPGSFVLIDKKQIVNMGETSEDFWQRFAVNLQSGIIYSKGNQSAQYNISSSVTYARPRWAVGLDFNSALSSNSGASTSTRNQLEPRCLSPAAVEELLLRRAGRHSAEHGAGHRPPHQRERRRREVPEALGTGQRVAARRASGGRTRSTRPRSSPRERRTFLPCWSTAAFVS